MNTAGKKKRSRGRPKIAARKVNITVRLGDEMVRKLDEWAKENGEIGRSAAVRQGIAKLIKS